VENLFLPAVWQARTKKTLDTREGAGVNSLFRKKGEKYLVRSPLHHFQDSWSYLQPLRLYHQIFCRFTF